MIGLFSRSMLRSRTWCLLREVLFDPPPGIDGGSGRGFSFLHLRLDKAQRSIVGRSSRRVCASNFGQRNSWANENRSILIENLEDIPEPQSVARGMDLYFEVLELQPIKLSISFMRTERISAEEK